MLKLTQKTKYSVLEFFWLNFYAGVALDMLKANPNFATAKNEDGETALYVLAHNPSAFVSGSQLGY